MKNCRAAKRLTGRPAMGHRCYLAAHRTGQHACVCGLKWDSDEKPHVKGKLSPKLRALARKLVREAFAEAEAAEYHCRAAR